MGSSAVDPTSGSQLKGRPPAYLACIRRRGQDQADGAMRKPRISVVAHAAVRAQQPLSVKGQQPWKLASITHEDFRVYVKSRGGRQANVIRRNEKRHGCLAGTPHRRSAPGRTLTPELVRITACPSRVRAHSAPRSANPVTPHIASVSRGSMQETSAVRGMTCWALRDWHKAMDSCYDPTLRKAVVVVDI